MEHLQPVTTLTPSVVDPLITTDKKVNQEVMVIYGVYCHTVPVQGQTIAQVRQLLQTKFNIDPAAAAVVDGVTKDETDIVTGSILTFVKKSGEKGVSPATITIYVTGGIRG